MSAMWSRAGHLHAACNAIAPEEAVAPILLGRLEPNFIVREAQRNEVMRRLPSRARKR
jgi:hypothetical protein